MAPVIPWAKLRCSTRKITIVGSRVSIVALRVEC